MVNICFKSFKGINRIGIKPCTAFTRWCYMTVFHRFPVWSWPPLIVIFCPLPVWIEFLPDLLAFIFLNGPIHLLFLSLNSVIYPLQLFIFLAFFLCHSYCKRLIVSMETLGLPGNSPHSTLFWITILFTKWFCLLTLFLFSLALFFLCLKSIINSLQFFTFFLFLLSDKTSITFY